MKNSDLKNLADYPAMLQLSESLWNVGKVRGAAVMVGAGFSRNADRPSPKSLEPPLWRDFEVRLKEKLYPGRETTANVLQLAEEFKAEFGKIELENLIRGMIPDDQWKPGGLHFQLVSLPWNDILTTNWDTLLERAALQSCRRRCEIVYTINDIASTRAPRIVKLHGSLPSYTPFIFSEEDYRTYPRRYAPFVNLVRQVLLENDLCLVGFSASDPNFAEWIGWIRDELGDHARRVFLVGALDLTASRRRYLESLNVTPIDFTPLFADADGTDPHAEAVKRFLDFLHEKEPPPVCNWPWNEGLSILRSGNRIAGVKGNTERGNTEIRSSLKALINKLQILREKYPGWLVCPNYKREIIIFWAGEILGQTKVASEVLTHEDFAALISETAWILEISLAPVLLPFPGLAARCVDGDLSAHLPIDARSRIANLLLRAAREADDDERFEHWYGWLNAHALNLEENKTRAAYQRALRARDRLEFAELEKLLPEISGDDPAWKLRRAALHTELDELGEATKLISDAARDLEERFARDRSSIWIISRLAVAGWLSRVLERHSQNHLREATYSGFDWVNDWPPIFHMHNCDPWDELAILDRKIVQTCIETETATDIRPQFDAGHYTDNSNSTSWVSWTEIPAADLLYRYADEAGIPGKLDHTLLLSTSLQQSIDNISRDGVWKHLIKMRVYLNATSNALDDVLGRIFVASIPVDIHNILMMKLRDAVLFGINRLSRRRARGNIFPWVQKTHYLMEFQSRIIIRAPAEIAAEIFDEALPLVRDRRFHDQQLIRGLKHLLLRSFEAMPPADRGRRVLDLLNMPLPCEVDWVPPTNDWPELIGHPTIRLGDVRRPTGDHDWKSRISQLINIARSDVAKSRPLAISRLTWLHDMGHLQARECTAFGKAIWCQRKNDAAFPENTGIYNWELLSLPEPVAGHADTLFRRTYFALSAGELTLDETLIEEICGAGQGRKTTKTCHPDKKEAEYLLDRLIAWRPQFPPARSFFVDDGGKKIAQRIGIAVGHTLLPVFDRASWPDKRTEAVKSWLDESGNIPSVIATLPELVRLNILPIDQAAEKLRRGLQGRDRHLSRIACQAVYGWMRSEPDSLPPLPVSIIKTVCAATANGRYPNLHLMVQLSAEFVGKNFLSEDETKILVEALDSLRIETEYDARQADKITLPFVRRSCVGLARTLHEKGESDLSIDYWLEVALNDPLPEVRYLLS